MKEAAMNEDYLRAMELKKDLQSIQFISQSDLEQCGKVGPNKCREVILKVLELDTQYCSYLVRAGPVHLEELQTRLYSLGSLKA